ncbi:Ig-like domain-containing protein [Singulisphaera sp. PoT]|uniref:Ig-like domain-containing protein n=1 Tax=Singulisphaera sp. PoT TaxID=3411797 RepID=UPI003BF4A917
MLVRIDDEGGSEVTLTNTATVVDNPIVVTGALDTASDSGLSSTDAITNVNHPVFKGTSEPRSVVTVFATPLTGGLTRPIGQATAGGDGNWQVTSSLLADGQYVITASAVDQFGHTHSGPVTLLPNAAQGALIIDTVGPKVTDVFFDRLNGQIDVVYQDERSGMNASTLVDSSNYSLTKPHTFPATYLVTELTPSSSSDPTAPVTVPVTLNGGKSLRGGFYTFTIRSFGPSNREGVRDVAGNALDGEFYGKFPSGNGERGGDFVAMLDAVHRRIFAPQTVVGTASPANDGQGGAPVGAVHSGVFTLVHPRRTGAMQPFAFAAGRLRLGHRVNSPLRLAGLHPAGPLRAHRHH